MKPARTFLTLLLFALNLTSCMITDSARTTQIEIMKPGVFNLPGEINTVAIINRAPYQLDSVPFQYLNGTKIETDTLVKYRTLSNNCVDALTGFFEKEGYFSKVNNYRDSLDVIYSSNETGIITPEGLYRKTKSDICIFLDRFNFNVVAMYGFNDVVANGASLSWGISIKTDTLSYLYNQMDTLIYEAADFPLNLSDHAKLNLLATNSAEYLGRFFGSKIIPTWLTVERLYYRSHNQNMLLAEKYALNNEWLKAAEIWNKQTKNKNPKMAAKASYNMALACEMEGKLDAAIDWLVQSYSLLKENNEEHKDNCQRYIAVLAIRKKEIEKLAHQVRTN
jgi:Family of unknown function (DUF6340)